MNPWVLIIVGVIMVAIGTIIGSYGWYKLPRDSTKLETLIRESTKEIQQSIDQKIIEANKHLTVLTNINDPRMRDGGKVAVNVKWKDGPIIDIGNRNTPAQNRILLTAKYPDQIFLHLYGSDGKHYELQSEFSKIDKMVQLDCIWSSRNNFIAILVEGKILSKIQLPTLALFHDAGQSREILIGHSFEGAHGSGNIRNVNVFASKDL